MKLGRVNSALVLALLLVSCSETASTEVAQSPVSIAGLWTCDTQHEYDGMRMLMTGHSYYSVTGRYEGTGLGIVMYEREADQIRWMATSSGTYRMDGDQLIYNLKEVRAEPLQVIGYDEFSDAEKIEMAAEFTSMIDDQNVQAQSAILSLSSTDLVTQSQDPGEEYGVVNKCRKITEVR